MKDRIAALGALAGMVRDRDLSALAATAREVTAIEARISDLAAQVAARTAALHDLPDGDTAFAAGADAKWLAHLDSLRAALRQDLALALARREGAKAAALRALGRADVLDRLSKGR
jgi:hypothetical protein